MQFCIEFVNSGDTIPFVAINPDILEYYVDHLNQQKLNEFWIDNSEYCAGLSQLIDNLHQSLIENNIWFEQLFDQNFCTFTKEDYLNQKNLNYLHAAWVNAQSYTYDIDAKRKQFGYQGLSEQIHDMFPDSERFPLLHDIVNKIGVKTEFDKLNLYIHSIESSFSRLIFRCMIDWIEFPNPFDKKRINLDCCNLFLPFKHLGRSQYDKFINFDNELEYKDQNTFNEMLGYVALSLSQPQTTSYSPEYISWCNQHNIPPIGESIPLGNIPNLVTNLTNYRIIILRNTVAGNNFRINLNKG